jgi:SAM dependent carboxyl methyltransferase
VSKLYLEQFQKDFFSFLKHRSEELYSEGRMVLIFAARTSAEPTVEESVVLISWYEEAFYELVYQVLVVFLSYCFRFI